MNNRAQTKSCSILSANSGIISVWVLKLINIGGVGRQEGEVSGEYVQEWMVTGVCRSTLVCLISACLPKQFLPCQSAAPFEQEVHVIVQSD